LIIIEIVETVEIVKAFFSRDQRSENKSRVEQSAGNRELAADRGIRFSSHPTSHLALGRRPEDN